MSDENETSGITFTIFPDDGRPGSASHTFWQELQKSPTIAFHNGKVFYWPPGPMVGDPEVMTHEEFRTRYPQYAE